MKNNFYLRSVHLAVYWVFSTRIALTYLNSGCLVTDLFPLVFSYSVASNVSIVSMQPITYFL